MKISIPPIKCYHPKKKRKYDSNVFVFDTEVTSLFKIDEEWATFDFTKPKEFYVDKEKASVLYAWAFWCGGRNYRGRTLSEFVSVLEQLKDEKYIKVIYIQNLSYEFQFLLNIIPDLSPFALKPHKVVKAYTETYNIEFRCSYLLSGVSLKKFHDMFNLKSKKHVGDLDYNLCHLPITPLTETEWGYIEADTETVAEYISKLVDEYGSIDDIPLTQTGRVRKEVKDIFKDDKKYLHKIADMFPDKIKEFRELVEIFAGGYTHANWNYSNKIIENVYTDDLSSDYPAQMVTQKFPMSKFYKYYGDFDKLNTDIFAYYALIELYGVSAKMFNTFISLSKAQDARGYSLDNGRILNADYVKIRVTDCDFKIIKMAYDIKEIKILEVKIAKKDYLDNRFRRYILDLYRYKTSLKGNTEMETLYKKSKEYINALYGMSVTNTYKDEVLFSEFGWFEKPLTVQDFEDKVKKEKYRNKIFLNYAWGVWVTAYARLELWKLIEKIDDYTVYCDTDSNKHIENEYVRKVINERNKEWEMKMLNAGLNYNDTHIKDNKGITHILGTFELEKEIAYQFKTMGAKKYCGVYEDGLHITVSGVNKDEGAKLLKTIDNFKKGFVFGYEINKMIMTYISNQHTITVTDYLGNTQTIEQCYGINAMPTTYKLGLSNSYEDLLVFVNQHNTNLSKSLGGFNMKAVQFVGKLLCEESVTNDNF